MSLGDGLHGDMEAYFAAQPTKGDNPVGKLARHYFLTRACYTLQGYCRVGGMRRNYNNEFYPNLDKPADLGDIGKPTGLLIDWWRNFAAALASQAAQRITSVGGENINQSTVDAAMAKHNKELRAHAWGGYQYLMVRYFEPASKPYSALTADEAKKADARNTYIGYLKSDEWVTAKYAEYISGEWTDQAWELYHHWIKLYALGATFEEIDGVISYLLSLDFHPSFPIPNEVNAANWRDYIYWYEPADISWEDIKNVCSPAMTARHCDPPLVTRTPLGPKYTQNCQDEAIAKKFVNKGPGSRFTASYGGCFAGDARVLMADGSTRAIAEIEAGDDVQTPSGPKKVRARIETNHRVVHFCRLNDEATRFTADHLFATAYALQDEAPDYASVNPVRAMRAVPLMAPYGITQLTAGEPDLIQWDGGSQKPYRVSSVEQLELDPSGANVYDLIIAPNDKNRSEYLVALGDAFVVSGSGFAHYRADPITMRAFTEIVDTVWPQIQDELAWLPKQSWDEALAECIDTATSMLLRNTLAEISEWDSDERTDADFEIGEPEPNLVDHHLLSYQAPHPSDHFDRQKFVFYTLLAEAIVEPLDAAIMMGWRRVKPVSPAAATELGLGLHAVETDGEYSAIPGDRLNLSVTLARGHSRETHMMPLRAESENGGFYQGFDQSLSFANWRPIADATASPPWELEFRLFKDGNKKPLPLVGTAILPNRFEHGFRTMVGMVYNEDRQLSGRVRFSAYPSTPEISRQGQNNRDTWNKRKRRTFARQLSKQYSAVFPEAFLAAAANIKLEGQ